MKDQPCRVCLETQKYYVEELRLNHIGVEVRPANNRDGLCSKCRKSFRYHARLAKRNNHDNDVLPAFYKFAPWDGYTWKNVMITRPMAKFRRRRPKGWRR